MAIAVLLWIVTVKGFGRPHWTRSLVVVVTVMGWARRAPVHRRSHPARRERSVFILNSDL